MQIGKIGGKFIKNACLKFYASDSNNKITIYLRYIFRNKVNTMTQIIKIIKIGNRKNC